MEIVQVGVDALGLVEDSDVSFSENENSVEYSIKIGESVYFQVIEKSWLSKYKRNDFIKVPLEKEDFGNSAFVLIFKKFKAYLFKVYVYDEVTKKYLLQLENYKIS